MTWIAPAVAGGSGILSSFVNWGMAASQNKKQRKWSEKMAEKSWNRDIEAWNMQNKYNSPAEQMKRYQEAGLNPNLIYGQQNTADSISSYNDISGQDVYGLPQMEVGDMIGTYFDIKMKKEGVDRIKKMNELLDVQTIKEVYDMIYEHGTGSPAYNRLPKKYKLDKYEQSYPHYTGSKMYDLSILESRSRKGIADADYAKELLEYIRYKMKELQQNNVNIDRDDAIDRALGKMFKEKGGLGREGVRYFMMMLSKALGR